MKKSNYSVSVRHLDLAHLGASLQELASAPVAEWRIDIADGTFEPEFALGYEILETFRAISALPIHVNLLVENPDRFLDKLAQLGAKSLTVPVEACIHAHRTIGRIRELGLGAGVSVRPASELTKLEYLLGMVDHLVLPVRDRTAPNAPILSAAYDRVRILRENLDYRESKAILQVEGNLYPAEAARLAALGANGIVIDRKDVLQADPLAPSVQSFLDAVAAARKTA